MFLSPGFSEEPAPRNETPAQILYEGSRPYALPWPRHQGTNFYPWTSFRILFMMRVAVYKKKITKNLGIEPANGGFKGQVREIGWHRVVERLGFLFRIDNRIK